MARRSKKKKIPSVLLKTALVVLLASAIGFSLFKGVQYFMYESSYFQIKAVDIDPELGIISRRDVKRLIGESIFSVDLQKVHRGLSFKYPQISDLRVVRKFPNRIAIEARERKPVAQTSLNNKTLTLDDKGVVVSTRSKQDDALTYIAGLKIRGGNVGLGDAVRGRDMKTALDIINTFAGKSSLTDFRIRQIDVGNLSKIDLALNNRLKVIVDWDDIDRKMDMLSLVLTRGDIDFGRVKYIDLRFKEPIIGNK